MTQQQYTIEEIKAWRKREFDAGRPSSLSDFYAAYPNDEGTVIYATRAVKNLHRAVAERKAESESLLTLMEAAA